MALWRCVIEVLFEPPSSSLCDRGGLFALFPLFAPRIAWTYLILIVCCRAGAWFERDRLTLQSIPADAEGSGRADDALTDARAGVHVCVQLMWAAGVGLLVVSGRDNGELIASKTKDGSVQWSSPASGHPVTTLTAGRQAADLHVGWGNSTVAAVQRGDGKQRWNTRLGRGAGAVTAIEVAEEVFASTEGADLTPICHLSDTYLSSEGGEVFALDEKTGELLRSLKTPHETPVVSLHAARPFLASADSSGWIAVTSLENHVSEPFEVG